MQFFAIKSKHSGPLVVRSKAEVEAFMTAACMGVPEADHPQVLAITIPDAQLIEGTATATVEFHK